ncbi:MAG: hypothetical protein NUV90_03270 [Candidatus Parcubacteria bacterium]|nr:hypothetical protein [Candidatus Parcubacteria bacterium]
MDNKVALLSKYGATIEPDSHTAGAYILTFLLANAKTTIRISLHDYSGADMVITHMTTLPDTAKNNGYGSSALQSLLTWASENNLADIQAVQVQRPSERFWTKNGFAKMPAPNVCNDFAYQGHLK